MDWRIDDSDDERLELGRPKPEPQELMTARQLVYAYDEARTDEDREYAMAEAESFLYAAGDDVDGGVLVVLLGLPVTHVTRFVVELLEQMIIDRSPAVVPALVRATQAEPPLSINAARVLARLPLDELAAGLIHALAQPDPTIKGNAARMLVTLGRHAAGDILEALADPEIRPWMVRASGAAPLASDGEVMRAIMAAAGAQH